MGDILCKVMGLADIVAGGLIMCGFKFNSVSVVFGIIMMIKGGISFL